MTEQEIRKGQDKTLRKLLAAVSGGVGETLGSLVDKPLKIQPGVLDYIEPDDLLLELDGARVVARGALDKAYAGHFLLVSFTVPDAITLSGMMMMTPDEVIGERRKTPQWQDDDIEVFGEVGNILFSGVDEVLRSKVKGDIGLRLQDHHLIAAGQDEQGVLGEAPLIRWVGSMTVGDYPSGEITLLMDLETAEKWNCMPLLEPVDGAAPDRATTDAQQGSGLLDSPEEESLEDIPAAPIQGTIASYTGETKLMSTLRRACRRVGLEIERHSKAEVPNPAAHKDGLVLLDIPAGESRRFEWCKRLKDYEKNTTVLLTVHEPSRARVLQAFMARADFIIGWPVNDQALAAKLEDAIKAHGPLTPPATVEVETEPAAEGEAPPEGSGEGEGDTPEGDGA